jgi:hypothetical protein
MVEAYQTPNQIHVRRGDGKAMLIGQSKSGLARAFDDLRDPFKFEGNRYQSLVSCLASHVALPLDEFVPLFNPVLLLERPVLGHASGWKIDANQHQLQS